ncbi:MAG: M28 family peptidase [Candidatus Kapaibacterium sp.]
MNRTSLFFLIAFLLSITTAQTSEIYTSNDDFKEIARKIIKEAKSDTLAYHRLRYMCDVFGPRLSGSENLVKAIGWMSDEMKRDGFTNVRTDEVMVPHWVRRYENCDLLYPRKSNIPVFALGGSIATGKDGIHAEVIVVKDFDDLERRKDEVEGKIVVYNFDYQGYGKSVPYRFYGAVNAAKYGAVASLTRSVSPNVNRNLHTGMMIYEDTIPKIPHAAISPEDAMLLERLLSYGIKPKIKLTLDVETLPDVLSHNLIGELLGTDKPEEIIAIGGHSDSWDAGTGAHDNAGGCIVTWEAVRLLKRMNLIPARTIRIVQWTNEENGVRGGNAYRDAHSHEKHVLMFEHDSGIFKPSALRFTGPDSIRTMLNDLLPIFSSLNPSFKVSEGGGGVDITPMMNTGVSCMSIGTDDGGKYFHYHHSHSDTVDKINKDDLNDCIAVIAIAIYFYADLPLELINNK